MKIADFIKIRKKINKTQKEMAMLLGVSKKTIESYEQGLRNIPKNIERILYFILFKLNKSKLGPLKDCWDSHNCSDLKKEKCVAWNSQEGIYCWFITSKICVDRCCLNCQSFTEKLKKILSP
jgi:transcriptional regulator with XRE-family HTH domain